MKKMNKVLALLAFAGVVTGVSLKAADAVHPLAIAVTSIYDGMVKDGFTTGDLHKPAVEVAELFDTVNKAVWEVIEERRGARQSFTYWFSQREVQCVINGFDHVITAIEAAAPTVIWPTGIRSRVSDATRNEYKDTVIAAIDDMVKVIVAKADYAISKGFIIDHDKAVITTAIAPQIAALKQRVIDVFTIKPTAERVAALNARVPGAAGKKVAKLATDRVAAHAAAKAEVDEAAQVTRFGAVLRTIGRTSWFAAKTVAALAVVYSIPMALAYARAHGWIA